MKVLCKSIISVALIALGYLIFQHQSSAAFEFAAFLWLVAAMHWVLW